MKTTAIENSTALSRGTVTLLVLVAFLWALCFPLISLGLGSAPPLTFAGLRAVIAGGVLVGIAFSLGRPLPRSGRVWLGLVLVGLSATSLGFFGMFIGGGLVDPGLATVIENPQPLIASVLAWMILGEALDPGRRLGLALGFAGILLIAFTSIDEPRRCGLAQRNRLSAWRSLRCSVG